MNAFARRAALTVGYASSVDAMRGIVFEPLGAQGPAFHAGAVRRLLRARMLRASTARENTIAA